MSDIDQSLGQMEEMGDIKDGQMNEVPPVDPLVVE